ncbi:hypothetical protein M231_06808 [Tremella mesenterica]|uniref:Ribosomal RNA-processing protein 43 n=1 Tax=Tremella mesenterica TaxID=5217 RepID=A0A4Q1BAW2_TREME|nr:hypothetical protein M231_06808 [Tremella mesenterica]
MAITATTDALQGAQDQANSSTSTQSTTAAAAVYKRLHPQQYLSRFLAKGYRPDGRRVNEFREASLNTGSVSTADGSSLVRLGSTTVVCGIKAEIAEPTSSSPDQGYLIVPNVDLPALCSPRYKPGPPSDEAQVLSVWLYDLLISSRVVDLTSLCIVPGKAVWALYIDVVCINYDGNAFDAAVLAVMAALKNTKLHGARYNDETGKVNLIRGEKYSLKLGRIPLAASFGIFNE